MDDLRKAFWLSGLGIPEGFLTGKKAIIAQAGIILFFVLNIVPDYLSLLQTRILIKSSVSFKWKIFLDFSLTNLIFSLWLILLAIVFLLPEGELNFFEAVVVCLLIPYVLLFQWFTGVEFTDSGGMYILLLFLLSSFVTSIWIYLQISAEFIASKLALFSKINEIMNVEERPFTVLGIIMSSMIWVFCLLIAIFF